MLGCLNSSNITLPIKCSKPLATGDNVGTIVIDCYENTCF